MREEIVVEGFYSAGNAPVDIIVLSRFNSVGVISGWPQQNTAGDNVRTGPVRWFDE